MLSSRDSWDPVDSTGEFFVATETGRREVTVRSEASDRGLTVRLGGILNGAGARELCERLRELLRQGREAVLLDGSELRELSDFGAAVLSLALRCEPLLRARVSLDSFSLPARRKLGRFGVGVAGAPPD